MTERGRVAAFDGLRGVWALGVVLSHVAAIVYVPFLPQTAAPAAWSYLLWHLGAPAVDGFFVLSGLVLSDAWARRPAYRAFVISRIWRLYPTLLLGALMGLTLGRWAAGQLSAGALPGGIPGLIQQPLRLEDVIGALTLMVPGFDADRVNAPLWSLSAEWLASLMMPVLVWVARRWRGWALLWLGLLVPLTALTLHWSAFFYLPLFLMGVLIAPVRVPELPVWVWRVLGVIGMLILYGRVFVGSTDEWARDLTAPGAALLLISVRAAPVAWLRGPAVQWLGSRSYALYALHFPLLLLGAALLPSRPAFGAAMMIPAALMLAESVTRLTQALTARVNHRPLPMTPGGFP